MAIRDDEQATIEAVTILQLGYASASTVAFTDQDLVDLLATSRENNAKAGIGGMLLFHEGSFLQVLEGPAERVEALYERIRLDPRHNDAFLLFRREHTHRQFADWSMGFHRVAADPSKRPPGLNSFLTSGRTRMTDKDAEKIRRILLGFREGRWHR
ncbi:MAG: BLUF domain-containing protein [Myxococcota bacterium]